MLIEKLFTVIFQMIDIIKRPCPPEERSSEELS